jgi:hypothetical protein
MVDASIAGVAARQHGNITRRQLLDLGLDDSAISYRLRIGRLHRAHRGVYSVGHPPVKPIERAAAAVLACGCDAVLSHGSAASLWGFAKGWRTPFEVSTPTLRRPRAIRTHRSSTLTRPDITKHLGIRVTSPARTLLDCAERLSDAALTRMVNEARLSNYLHLADLAELLERVPRHPSARRLKPFVENPGNPTRSGLEDDFPEFCECHDLPVPEMNARVGGREADAVFWPERLSVELDGYEYHSGRDAFERDRDQDAEALRYGFGTIRITWERIHEDPLREAERLRAILTQRREMLAERSAMLAKRRAV